MIFRELPDTFGESKINIHLAQKQHGKYTQACTDACYSLECEKEYIVLPKANQYPDSACLGDRLLAIGKSIVILCQGHEADLLYKDIQSNKRFESYNIQIASGLHGGDVFRVDNHVFVGLSEKTSQNGVNELNRICKPLNRRVHPVRSGTKHLKSLVSYLGPEIGLVAANTLEGHVVVQQILKHTGQMVVHYIDDVNAVDVIRVGNTVLYPKGAAIDLLRNSCRHLTIVFHGVDMSELNKVGKHGASLSRYSMYLHV